MRNETEIKQSIKETHEFICHFENTYDFFNYDDFVASHILKKIEYEIILSIVAISVKNEDLRNNLKTTVNNIIKDKESVNKYNTIQLASIIKIINKINDTNINEFEYEFEYIHKITMHIMQLTKLEIFVLCEIIIKSDIIRKKLKEYLEYMLL